MHVVMVDGALPGIMALQAAIRRGYRTTFLHGHERWFQGGQAEAIVAGAAEVVPIEDSSDADAIETALRDLHARHPVDLVFTTLHECVLPAARAARRLGLPSTSEEGALIACHKDLARARLVERGIPSIRYELVDGPQAARAAASRLGFPVVVKPSRGVAKLFTRIARRAAEVDEAVAAYEAGRSQVASSLRRSCEGMLLLEEYMPGRMLSVEVGAVDGRAFVIAIGERNRAAHNELVELGTTFPAPLAAPEVREVRDYAVRVVDAFGLDRGVFHVEIMLTARGPRLIEVNPRLGGGGMGRAIGLSLGIDMFDLLLDIYLGSPVTVPPSSATIVLKPIACLHAGVVGAYDLSWLEQYRDHVIVFTFTPRPGDLVQGIQGNLDYLGRMILRAEDPVRGKALAEEILARLSASIGLDLAR